MDIFRCAGLAILLAFFVAGCSMRADSKEAAYNSEVVVHSVITGMEASRVEDSAEHLLEQNTEARGVANKWCPHGYRRCIEKRCRSDGERPYALGI